MDERRRRITQIIRWSMWSFAVAFLFVLALRDLGPGRTMVFVAKLDRATPSVSTFGPPARVVLAREGVRVVGEPVYVNVRMPRWFSRAVVEIVYENPTALAEVAVGPRTDPTQWLFELRSVEDALRHPPNGPVKGDGVEVVRDGVFVRARVRFALSRSWQVERNVYQLVVAAPGAGPERPLVIHSFRVTAERDPLCMGKFCV